MLLIFYFQIDGVHISSDKMLLVKENGQLDLCSESGIRHMWLYILKIYTIENFYTLTSRCGSQLDYSKNMCFKVYKSDSLENCK